MNGRTARIPMGPRRWLTTMVLAALLVAARDGAAAAPKPSAPPIDPSDPWSAVQLVRPADLASTLKSAKGERPVLLHVGFKRLYRAGAIPGSRYVGPGSTPEGLAALQQAVKGLPRDRSIVLYCGCCPWDHCPNMRPAFRTLAAMGFKRARALYIERNLESDWANAGYPIEKPKD